MVSYFIDTNIFLRVLIEEDPIAHEQCIRLLELVKRNKLKAQTGTIVLAEVMWTLLSHYKLSKQKATDSVLSILNLRGLKIVDNYDHRLAVNLFSKYSVKYIDCLIASDLQIHNKQTTIVSYDNDFKKLPRSEEHTSELQSHSFISYAVFCLQKKTMYTINIASL